MANERWNPAELVAGVDEAGRGPLAGPVAAAAVILDPERIPAGLDDSKALSAAVRETLFETIMREAVAVSIAMAGPATIDRINIRAATLDAMRRAVQGLAHRPARAEIDGKDVPPGLPCPGRAIVDGDALVAAISAASIVAKVTRDRLMTRLAAEFPVYGFERHMGYGTAEHRAAITAHGPCVHHRFSFGLLKTMRAG
ncbi:ribonuclease HII [Labrys wisconsinensis]|uniref:Ribonuclease HII n=1 Tax=Labrys wisconsinensis TaxID=425677 RepID=A0ABU0J8C6_9HYPH|nr:ribonuclease HII [Labrys wisconsinensis]MDQ0470509.1 ribonuclease HII [Labrys wisconsinensis]